MSRAPPVVIIHNIDGIVRSVNNGDLTARLVWVDPAVTPNNYIKCTISDQTRSIRLTLWGYDLETKKFLSNNMLKIFCWSGLTARLTKNDPTLQREHLFTLSLNENDDKFKMGFVGRFQIVEGCTIPFLDIAVPRPELMSQTPLPTPTASHDMNSSKTMPVSAEKRGRDDEVLIPKRERDDDTLAWICPVAGCRLPDYAYCMMTGKLHPAVCAQCGTQGKYLFCPASPRGVKVMHIDMIPTSEVSAPGEKLGGTLTFGLPAGDIDHIRRHAAMVKELFGSIPLDATTDKAGGESKADVGTTVKTTDDQATADKATSDKATDDMPKADKTRDDQATADKATAENFKANKATADKATAEKATADNAAAEKAEADKAAAEKVKADKAAAEKATAEKAAAEKAAAEKAAADKVKADKAAAEKAAAVKNAAETVKKNTAQQNKH